MKIGVYVGSFNPIHNVHLKIAKMFLDSSVLDKVIFVPAGDEYNKKGLASGANRLKMIEIAIKDEPRFEVSDIEVKHRKLSTYQTLTYLKNQINIEDELFLIMGTDNLKELYWWDHCKELTQQFKILVLTRDGLHKQDFPEYAENTNICFFDFDIDMSATSVRFDLQTKNFNKAREKLKPEVLEFIVSQNLYLEN